MFRAGGEFICISFDSAGRIVSRGLGFGRFSDVARNLQDEFSAKQFDMGGALIAAPSLFPNELSEVVRDALMLRLPYSVAKTLSPHERAAWGSGA
jgi:hypothetical protein